MTCDIRYSLEEKRKDVINSLVVKQWNDKNHLNNNNQFICH